MDAITAFHKEAKLLGFNISDLDTHLDLIDKKILEYKEAINTLQKQKDDWMRNYLIKSKLECEKSLIQEGFIPHQLVASFWKMISNFIVSYYCRHVQGYQLSFTTCDQHSSIMKQFLEANNQLWAVKEVFPISNKVSQAMFLCGCKCSISSKMESLYATSHLRLSM
jgi:hypothetical protein